ncbi:MAG: alpha-glucan family phosphorylase, partial [Anaerolineae bacterium]
MSQAWDPIPDPPERIAGLKDVAYNLWWSWHPDAQRLFRSLSHQAWRDSDGNPIEMLRILPAEVLAAAAHDEAFLKRYDAVVAAYEEECASGEGWFTDQCGEVDAPLAYISAEYGLHSSLPVYAGGLGILAGDHLKEASDLGVPLIAVGMFYRQAYVHQRIREDGWQDDVEETLDRTYNPIERILDEDGKPLRVTVPALSPQVDVHVWRVKVGRVSLYLLDPAIDGNRAWDKDIASRLYISDPEQRLRQEILLGMGGMAALEALGIQPTALHLNEGHAALATLARLGVRLREGKALEDALADVRATTVFTTHTPVPAGTDVFPFRLMQRYLGSYLDDLGVDRERFFELGANPKDPEAGFNMAVFALRMANARNAVSQRHGEVAREMWSHLWPDKPQDEIPIDAITNGVHVSSWVDATYMHRLFAQTLGEDWVARQDEAEIWEAVDDIPDRRLWEDHQELKTDLLAEIGARARMRWHDDRAAASSILAFGALLDPDVLTIGYARRFTAYKRPTLIMQDLERLKAMVTDRLQPVQIIFAGEAHPADSEGKRLIQEIFRRAQDPEFAGRIAFVEDYDQELAADMVCGVDVWLNNPVP